jgi:hypothetical protein
MATKVNRYKQLLAGVPKGSFYASDGQVLPFRDTPYELRISTGVASQEYRVLVNDKFSGFVTTNTSGVALVTVLLDKGANELKLVDTSTQKETIAFITTRDYATLMAAEAEVIEAIDTGIEQVLLDARLDTASISLIEEVFGKTVQTGNNFGYDLDTYRELLQELRTAYRYYGGTVEGISRVVRAFTQISPLIYQSSFGPQWVLGKDILFPAVNTTGRTYYTTSALTNINVGGAGVTITSISNTVGIGTGILKLYGTLSPKKLTWQPPSGDEGPQVDITSNGIYTLYAKNYFDDIIGVPGPFNIAAGFNDKLALEIDDKGIVVVTITAGASVTAATIAADINNAFSADARYGAAYNAVASSYDAFGSGTPMVKLTTPNAATTGSVTIHFNSPYDAAQTIFNLPVVRGGLQSNVSAGASSLVLGTTTNMDPWPLPTVDQPIDVIIGHGIYHPVGGPPNLSSAPTGLELVKVTNINKTTRTLTLQSPTVLSHASTEMVYLVGEIPYKRSNVQNPRSIKVKVTTAASLPTSTVTDSVVISGSGLPDGWVVTTNAGGAPTLTGFQKHTYFEIDRDLPFDISPDHRVSIPVPDEILKYKGFNVLVSVWGRIDDPSRAATQTSISTIGVSFDNQSSYDTAAPTVSGLAVNSQWRPNQYSRTLIIPSNATKMWLRITTSTGTNGNFTIHRVRVTVPASHGGLFLGDGTTPRNEAKIKHGSFMYVWSRDQLSTEEKKAIGVAQSTQVNPGHIDKIAPAMAWLEKFDVSKYDSSNQPINVKGSFSETQFLTGTSTNLSLVLRTPSRFSYLKPAIPNEVTQTVQFSATFPHVATLTINADQDKSKAVLTENGIPVTKDQWQFDSATQIRLLYTPLNATYELRYNALLRFETPVIDLGTAFADYLWFADYHVLLRPEIKVLNATVTTGIQFDSIGNAVLPERSTKDKTTALLIADTGLTKRIIPASQWTFIDPQTIRISLDVFNPSALYEFTYTAEVNHPSTDAIATVEIKSASSQGGLSGASYTTVKPNQPIGNSLRYHQMRVTLNGIRDVRDARILSLLIKGLGLFGTGLTVPVLRP